VRFRLRSKHQGLLCVRRYAPHPSLEPFLKNLLEKCLESKFKPIPYFDEVLCEDDNLEL